MAMRGISHSIRRIAFFGTPVGRPMKRDWVEALAKQLTLYSATTDKRRLEDLEVPSRRLADIVTDFSRLLAWRARTDEIVEVTCFFEGLYTNIGRINIGPVMTLSLFAKSYFVFVG
jgi:hypothetical protein